VVDKAKRSRWRWCPDGRQHYSVETMGQISMDGSFTVRIFCRTACGKQFENFAPRPRHGHTLCATCLEEHKYDPEEL
jgi:hypothetical protein